MSSSEFKYRGFFSYSHQDRAFGEWLHDRIERCKVPKDLIGKQGRHGLIPAKLRPVFRDRFDLEAGHSLNEKITEALSRSESLIVMCSPGAAKSEAVNEEIRLFKSSGRSEWIYPIIVEGSPSDGEVGCFPPMLTAVLDANGQPTGEEISPIAADARSHGDGKELAAQKIIAAMLGVHLDELRRREEIARRRELRRNRLIAATMTLLAMAALTGWGFAWKAKEEEAAQRKVAEEQRAEADKQRAIADRQKTVAENLYERALAETLRLIVTKASYETELTGKSFQVSQQEIKGGDNSFQEFVKLDPRGSDYIFHRLTEVLLEFADRPPRELEEFDLKEDWLKHAKVIITNLRRGDRENEALRKTDERVDKALARLSN